MDSPISRAEHEEFRRRMEEEHNRQNARIKLLEDENKQINDIVVSINKLASSIQTMTSELKQQGSKLEKLEARDGEKWRKVASYVVTTIIGLVIGFIFRQIGM